MKFLPKKQGDLLKKIQEKALMDQLPNIPIGGIKFKHLKENMSFLAIITDISMTDIRVALPYGLVGFISLTEITKVYENKVRSLLDEQLGNPGHGEPEEQDESELAESDAQKIEQELAVWKNWFKIGQYLPVLVKKLTKHAEKSKTQIIHNRIECSIQPELLNASVDQLWKGLQLSVTIKEIQEKGALLQINDRLEGFYKSDASFLVKGQWLWLQVGKPDGRLPQFISPNELSSSSPFLKDLNDVSMLRANDVVRNLSVIKVIPGKGLILDMGMFSRHFAILDINHIPADKPLCSFAEDDVVELVKILYVVPSGTDSYVAVTILPHLLVCPTSTLDISKKIGLFIGDSVIKRVEAKVGLSVSFKLDDKETLGFIFDPSSLLMMPNSIIHKARIVDYRPIENLYILSTDSEIMNAPFLSFDEIIPGVKVKGTVQKLTDSGAVITLTDRIKGFCPKGHYTGHGDTPMTHNLKAGQSCNFRIWAVNPKEKKIILTKKPTLVQSLYESYNEKSIGPFHGVVLSVKPKVGAVIGFYGDIRKFLPISFIQENVFIKDLVSLLPVGMVIKVWRHDDNRVTMIELKTPKNELIGIVNAVETPNGSDLNMITETITGDLKLPAKRNQKRKKNMADILDIDARIQQATPLKFEEESDDESTEKSTDSLSLDVKPKKKKSRREEEAEISKIETELLTKISLDSIPDFEKAVLADATQPLIWIQYVTFLLSQIIVDTAKVRADSSVKITLPMVRQLVQRALDSIPYFKEDNKMKIWTIALTMEWQLFTEQVAIDKSAYEANDITHSKEHYFEELVKDALKRCEPLKVYILLWDMYLKDMKVVHTMALERLFNLENAILKKNSTVKHQVALWERICQLYWELHLENPSKYPEDLIKSKYNKSLSVYLSKDDGILLTSKIANLEYSYGLGRRGNFAIEYEGKILWKWIELARTRYESLITNHPKRFHLWTLYINQETKLLHTFKNPHQEVVCDEKDLFGHTLTQVRRIFERALVLSNQKMTGGFHKKQMKTLFKMYLDSETNFGTSSFINHVKKLATEYVESLSQ